MHDLALQVSPSEPFTVFRAVPLKAWLLEQLDAHPEGLVLDLSGVEDIDTAGVQLLLMLMREAASQARPLTFGAPSEPVRAIFELYGLGAELRSVLAVDDHEALRRLSG